jgi:hypothetical protein
LEGRAGDNTLLSRCGLTIVNRMINGYLLRDVINKINGIHFNSTEENLLLHGMDYPRISPGNSLDVYVYTKTAPIQLEEFADCIAWWTKRKESDRAWEVPAKQIIDNGCNLDIKNPAAKEDLEHLQPEQLVESIMEKEKRILEIMGEIKALLAEGPNG